MVRCTRALSVEKAAISHSCFLRIHLEARGGGCLRLPGLQLCSCASSSWGGATLTPELPPECLEGQGTEPRTYLTGEEPATGSERFLVTLTRGRWTAFILNGNCSYFPGKDKPLS